MEDAPATDYRGFLVDSARYLLPVNFLKHVIEVMSFLKYTHLHWHLTDDQSFALNLRAGQTHASAGAGSGVLKYTKVGRCRLTL